MPTGYSYHLGAPGTVTGKRTRIPYLVARKTDPETRDLVLRDSTWELGSPAVEIVLLTLATPLGTCLLDPTWGPDYSILDTQTRQTAARWKDSVEKALARFVPEVIENVVVEADVPVRGRLVYSVTFTDVRASDRGPITLPLVARAA